MPPTPDQRVAYEDAEGIILKCWQASASDECVECEFHDCQHSMLMAVSLYLFHQAHSWDRLFEKPDLK